MHGQALNYLLKMETLINFLPYLPVPAYFFSFEAQTNQRHSIHVSWEKEMHRCHRLRCSQGLEVLIQGTLYCRLLQGS